MAYTSLDYKVLVLNNSSKPHSLYTRILGLMKYSFRNPLPERQFSLRIQHSGQVLEKDKYQYYKGGEGTWVDNLDPKQASLKLFEDIVAELGYKNPKFSFRRSGDICISELKNDDDVKELIGELPQSGLQEIEVYLEGDRETIEVENYPKILLWNCRGANDPTCDMLRALVDIYNPDIVFLIETRLSSKFLSDISINKLGFQNFRDSPTNKHMENLDNCVGLAALWKSNVKLHFYNRSENDLDFTVNDRKWRLTLFYGDPNKKDNLWLWLEELSKDSPNLKGEWVVFSDFNEVLNSKEKIGGREKTNIETSKFQKALDTCKLVDLFFVGTEFTWIGNNNIKERLDRAVANEAWKSLFPNFKVLHLTHVTFSDHVPILLETDSEKPRSEGRTVQSPLMTKFLQFVNRVEKQYPSMDIPTTSQFDKQLKLPFRVPDFYYDIVKHVAPHIFQLKYIAVCEKNKDKEKEKKKGNEGKGKTKGKLGKEKDKGNEKEKEKDKITYERIVTLTTRNNLSDFLVSYMVFYKPSREEGYHGNAISFPKVKCGKSMKNVSNYSEYFAEALDLIKLIQPDSKITEQQIVEQRTNGQLDNLLKWVARVVTDGDYSNIQKNLEQTNSDLVTIGRAVILCNTIAALIKEKKIKCEGTKIELKKNFEVYFESYLSIKDRVKLKEMVGKDLDHLLQTLQWHPSNNNSRYKIYGAAEERLPELEEQMFMAERELAAVRILDPWVKLIEENGIDKKKLIKFVDESKIKEQLKDLRDRGCITCSQNDEIALSNDDKNPESIIGRLELALCEALRTLKNTKSMTREAYLEYLQQILQNRENRNFAVK